MYPPAFSFLPPLRTTGVAAALPLRSAGLAAVVAENLRQVLERAQLMGVVAQHGLRNGSRYWQEQLAQMLGRDRIFVRMAVFDATQRWVAGSAASVQALAPGLPHPSGACPVGQGAQVLHQQARLQEQAWQLPLLLCLADAQGAPTGYLLLHIDLGYFLGLYQDVDLGDSGVLHVLAPDGHVVAAMAGGGLLWIASNSSTIPWGTTLAMPCCRRWRSACAACCAARTSLRAWGATSLPC